MANVTCPSGGRPVSVGWLVRSEGNRSGSVRAETATSVRPRMNLARGSRRATLSARAASRRPLGNALRVRSWVKVDHLYDNAGAAIGQWQQVMHNFDLPRGAAIAKSLWGCRRQSN